MRLGQAVTVGALLSLALILTGCGEESTAGSRRAKAPPGEPGPVALAASHAGCRQLRTFLDSMDSLRESLAAGLSYEDYLAQLRGVTAAYDEIETDRLPVACLLLAGGPGERALNRYIGAANEWGECLTAAACEIESIEPKLQRRWALASDLLSSAQAGL